MLKPEIDKEGKGNKISNSAFSPPLSKPLSFIYIVFTLNLKQNLKTLLSNPDPRPCLETRPGCGTCWKMIHGRVI